MVNARVSAATAGDGRVRMLQPVSTDREINAAAGWILTATIAASLFWVAFDHGSFDIGGRALITVTVWWLLAGAVALGLWPDRRVPVEALVAAGGLAGLAAWTGASIAWAGSAEDALTELNRVLLYLGVFLAAALGGSPRNVARLCDGAAIALTAVGVLALLTRLFPDLVDTSESLRFLPYGRTRLNYPVGYWNGLSILLALAIPLVLRLALGSRLPMRALAVSALPALGGTMYLTGSRTGAITGMVAAVVFLTLTSRRLAAGAALLVGGIATAGVVAVLASRNTLVDGPLESQLAEEQGREAAGLIVLVCLAAGLTYAAGSVLARRVPQPGPGAERTPLAVLAIALVLGVLVSDPVQRFEDFKLLPADLEDQGTNVQNRLANPSGNGRWQMWTAAADQFRAHPVVGDGAGTFQSWWERHRPLALFVRDAHSLYVETLGELGIVGLLLLMTTLGAGVTAVARRSRYGDDDRRRTFAALTAALAAFAVATAADWMWEFTVVSVVGVATLGLVTGPATATSAEPVSPSRPRLRGAAIAFAVAAIVIVLTSIPLLAEIKLRDSQSSVRRGDLSAALDDAQAARSLAPWAASPYLQTALVLETEERYNAARSWIAEAIERDRANWTLWLVDARIETRAGKIAAARRSLAQARAMNPLSFLGSGDRGGR